MERRELFTRLFGSRSAQETVPQEPDPVLQTPAYLNTAAAQPVNLTWYELPENGQYHANTANMYGLEFRMEVIPEMFADSAHFMMFSVPAEGQDAQPIGFGMNDQYELFINDEVDTRQSEPDSLLGAVQMVLNVSPQPEGQAFTSLKLVDHYGMTLATLKSNQYQLADWTGTFEPGRGLAPEAEKPAGWRIRVVQINGYQNKTT